MCSVSQDVYVFLQTVEVCIYKKLARRCSKAILSTMLSYVGISPFPCTDGDGDSGRCCYVQVTLKNTCKGVVKEKVACHAMPFEIQHALLNMQAEF